MRELRKRAEPILRIVVLILAALVAYQLAGVFLRWNPFRGVTVPEVPTLTASTNNPAGSHGTNLLAAGKGTNQTLQLAGTNMTKFATATNANSVATTNLAAAGTNAGTNVFARQETKLSETNSAISTNAAGAGANVLVLAGGTTNALPAANAVTNSVAQAGPESTNRNAGTNVVAAAAKESGTNSTTATNLANQATNVLLSATATGTNSAPADRNEKNHAKGAPPPEMAGMNFNPFGPPGKSSLELPPAVKARISKIIDSEILGPVIHPLPMALLGIAGDVAFLRSASGQTGLVKTNDTLDDIKLLRIGVNRVLIEQAGEKKELTIFDGYGGESLLPNNSTNENKTP